MKEIILRMKGTLAFVIDFLKLFLEIVYMIILISGVLVYNVFNYITTYNQLKEGVNGSKI